MASAKLMNIAKALREQCFSTPAQSLRTLCCLVSMFVLGIALGVVENSIVVVTFCMLLVMAIVQGMSNSESPLLGPIAAVAFGSGGAIGLLIVNIAAERPASEIAWMAAAGGGATAAVWWIMLMARWVLPTTAVRNGDKRERR